MAKYTFKINLAQTTFNTTAYNNIANTLGYWSAYDPLSIDPAHVVNTLNGTSTTTGFFQAWDAHQVVEPGSASGEGYTVTTPVKTGTFTQNDSGGHYYINPIKWAPDLLAAPFSGQQYYLVPDWKNVDGDGWTSSPLNGLGFIVNAGSWNGNAPTQLGGNPSNVNDKVGDFLYYSFKADNFIWDNVDNVPLAHTLYGQIESIEFGYGLQVTGGVASFSTSLLTLGGLDSIGLNGGFDASGNLIAKNGLVYQRDANGDFGPLNHDIKVAGQVNDTHEIIWGLMSGNTVDVVAYVAAAAAAAGASLDVQGDLGLLGVQDVTDTELALA